MKKGLKITLLAVFITLFVAGLLTLFIPSSSSFNSNFTYEDVTHDSRWQSGAWAFDVEFIIENDSETAYSDTAVVVKFQYYSSGFNTHEAEVTINNVYLDKGENTINFSYYETGTSVYFDKIEEVKIEVNANGFFNINSGDNFFANFTPRTWIGISLTIFGFFAIVVTLITSFSINKFKEIETNVAPVITSFEEKIKNAFSNVNNTESSTIKKNDKYVCKYCHCKYDSSLDKCPNCGAPPEPND